MSLALFRAFGPYFQVVLVEKAILWYRKPVFAIRETFPTTNSKICQTQEESQKAYMATIIKNKLFDILRERRSSKRNDFFQAISLNQFLEDNSDSPFLAHPSQQDPADEAHRSEFKFKLDQVFKKLNPQQRQVYSALRDGQLTITQISVRLKLHRNTIRNEINRIREVFEREGLKEFLR